jgi:hypothetical protein
MIGPAGTFQSDYALTGPTTAAPLLPLADSAEGAVEELIFRGAIFRLLSHVFGVWWALGLYNGHPILHA